MASQNSTQYGNTQADPRVLNEVNEDRGRVRVKAFDFEQSGSGSAGDLVLLASMDAGKSRILQAVLTNSAFGSGRTLDLGHQGYVPLVGSSNVAPDPDAFSDGLDVSAAATNVIHINKVVAAKDAFVLTAQINDGTIPANAKLSGYIMYVVD